LAVRAWRFSYNARGIIEIPNRLKSSATALIVVHPWGIDDGQGWRTPEPAGAADFCTPTKNHLSHKHIVDVLNPLIKSLRPRVATVMYSQPGGEDPIRKKLYRSIRGQPTAEERRQGQKELEVKLNSFNYTGSPIPDTLTLSKSKPVVDYFRQFQGLDAGDRYDPPGFWQLPIPVVRGIDVADKDVLIYDGEGYPPLRDYLNKQGIRHVLLTGYCTDMCVKATTAGYLNLRQDFNVFLVGDATLATFPAAEGPACATSAAIRFASLDLLITQISWVKPVR
jgi:nicotinamidase-related amidase